MSFRHCRSKRPGALQLRSKMLLYILSVVVIIFSAVTFYVAVSSSAKVSHDAETLTLASSRVAALTVTDTITSNINILTTIAEAIPRLDSSLGSSRNTVLTLLESGALQRPEIISMWLAFEPDAFDGRDSDFAGDEWYGKTGQFTASFVERDGKAVRTNDVTPEKIYVPGDGDFYTVPLRTGEPTVGDPEFYTYENGAKALIAPISVPIKMDGKTVGVVGIDLDYTLIQESLKSIRIISDRTIVLLIDDDGFIIYSSAPKFSGKQLGDIIHGQEHADETLRSIKEGRDYFRYGHSATLGGQVLMTYTPVRLPPHKADPLRQCPGSGGRHVGRVPLDDSQHDPGRRRGAAPDLRDRLLVHRAHPASHQRLWWASEACRYARFFDRPIQSLAVRLQG